MTSVGKCASGVYSQAPALSGLARRGASAELPGPVCGPGVTQQSSLKEPAGDGGFFDTAPRC